MNPLKVLVTGATGFLGAHLVRQLLVRGHLVIAMHRANSNLWRLRALRGDIGLVEADLPCRTPIENALRNNHVDVVIHCAAYGVKYEEQDGNKAFMVNVQGTSNLILAAREAGISRFIHIGSCFEYGNKNHPIHENEVLEPTSLYGVSKASGTLLALVLSKQNNVPLVVVRLFGLWGPLEGEDRLVPQVIYHCLTKTRLKLTGCEQIRDYVFVEDAACMLVDLIEISEFIPYEIFNLASGIPVKLREFVTKIASLFHREGLMLFGELPYRPTEMWHLVGSVEKWTKHVGKIRQSSISEGVQKILEAHDVR